MDTPKHGSSPEMQVTSIRLEAELKEKLRELSGSQGYQALIRDVLWNYVQQSSPHEPKLSFSDIRTRTVAIAQREERCVLTGQLIRPQELMWLAVTTDGNLVPLSFETWK